MEFVDEEAVLLAAPKPFGADALGILFLEVVLREELGGARFLI